jgi:hypothetical protein
MPTETFWTFYLCTDEVFAKFLIRYCSSFVLQHPLTKDAWCAGLKYSA